MTATVAYRRNFHEDATPLSEDPRWHTFNKANVVQSPYGLELWCRNGWGSGVMLELPMEFGKWYAETRISGPTDALTTKICCLLWPNGGKPWPPEIDFNESGDRLRSNQTVHWGEQVDGHHPERHSSYVVDGSQNVWHTYGVEVRPGGDVTYFCDGVIRKRVVVPELPVGQLWNMHLRTDPHDRGDVTRMDVRKVAIYA